MLERFKVVPAVYLILMDGEKILLSKRKNTGFYDGWYGLVSGHVDGGESMSAAMVREAKEEAGIEVSEKDLEMACVMHRKSDDRESVDFFFISNSSSPIKFKNCEPDKCSDLALFDLSSLPHRTIPFILSALEAVVKKKTYIEFAWN